MNKYHNGKIYRLKNNNTKDVYVGSTVELLLSQRFSKHKYDFIQWKYYNNKSWMSSFKLFFVPGTYIKLIENYQCNSKEELLKRESYWIKRIKCVNEYMPFRTKKETDELYRKKNKNYGKEYYKNNKDKWVDSNNKRKKNIICECGGNFREYQKNRHSKSLMHKKYIENK